MSFFPLLNSEAYGKDKLTVETMSNLATELQDLDSERWEPYFEYLNVAIGAPYKKTCDTLCKSELLCPILNVQNDMYDTCIEEAKNAATNSFVSLTLMLLPAASLIGNFV